MTGKDTDKGGGGNGQDGPNGDRLLGITQVTRAVGTSHDACKEAGNKTINGTCEKKQKSRFVIKTNKQPPHR